MMLYCVGVGPGSPDLITIRGLDVLKRSDVIFVPAASKKTLGLTMKIISGLGNNLEEKVFKLEFPMTKNEDILRRSWEENVHMITGELEKGKTCSYAVLGDPMLYSTFGHIASLLREKNVDVNYIPGVSSFTACPARAGIVLADGRQSILVTSMENRDLIRMNAGLVDTMLLIKGQTDFKEFSSFLRDAGFGSNDLLMYGRRCEMDEERMELSDVSEWDGSKSEPDYFSLIVLRRHLYGK